MENTNYFELLGLSPADRWSEETFKKVLNAKQNLWSRESMSIGPEALIARQNLDLIPDIERVMGNKQLRIQHLQVVHVSPSEVRQQRLIEFERQLAIREVKGYLAEQEIYELKQAFRDVITEDEIVTQINVPVRTAENEAVHEGVLSLNSATLQDINEKLALIQVTDLYHLLQRAATTSSDDLSHTAEQLFHEMTLRQPKTAEVSARVSLAGHAKNIFSNPLLRQDYDTYCAQTTLTLQQDQATLDGKFESASGGLMASDTGSLAQDFVPPLVSAQEIAVQQLKLKNLGKALRLSWLWPADCYEVIVSYSELEWPQPQNGRNDNTRISLASYEEHGGHFDLYVAVRRHYYIIVTPLIKQDGKLIPGKDSQIQGSLIPHMVIRYEIKNPRFGYKDRTLHLYIQSPGSIPPLRLVSKRNGHPLDKNDGIPVYRESKEQQVSLPEIVIKLQSGAFPPNTYGKLFLEDDDLYSVVTIYHPDKKKLRLG